ncbi:uncharacterized protein K02A2.6-like [Toxorhynchites rutilus septentrionalis]|uniref:uncharacterized protein K02A2.6-like n=1 Tax=Toxorhynchites rutilus septentrionalis TaxID=329112 RepID=UPI00247AD7E4|nr:uncharacterized protein K02A2.6-like [Toxorhynchites rutilus septentrionalis]
MNVSVSDQMCDRERNKILFALNTKYRELFAENLQHPMEGFEANIVVRDHASPVFYKPYDVPFSLREKVSEELDRLVREDVLRSVQHSDWASPIVVVPKADGSVRICMDCKVTVNKVICNEHYPLPNINDVFANMSGYKYFAKLDLQGAYMQIKVTEKSQKFLVVNTHKGLYAFTRLPFGISSAASTFQRIMDEILTGIEGVQSYLDDIMIGSDTIEGLIATTYEVLDRKMKKHKVKVNLSKSEFLVREFQYLGHKVSERGLSPSDEKVKAIKEAPRPRDVSQLKSFLGMINYYSKFVPNLSMKLSPLYALLKKNVRFEWNDQCEKVFSECKKLLLSHKLLALYNPELPIVIICDASSNGVGAVLCHKLGGIEKPVFYVSSTLSVSEKNYPNLHREALAVVFGLTKFFKYIYGKSFTVVTDNKPLASIFDFKKGIPSLTVTRLQKYVHMLSIFDFNIEYRPGSKVSNADALSRLPIQGETGIADVADLRWLSGEAEVVDLELIGQATQDDPRMKELFLCVRDGWKESAIPADLKFYFSNQGCLSLYKNCVIYSERVIVPKSCRKRNLELLHGCHLGVIRMKQAARRFVYWQGLDKQIEEFVQQCEVRSSMGRTVKKKFSEWPKALCPFDRIHLDFFHLAGRTFLVMIDAYSKWMDIRMMHRTDAEALINVLNSIFRIFGICGTIVSDNGPPLTSNAFSEYAKSMRIKFMKSPAYSPESNGLAERAVQTAKNGIKKLLVDPKFNHKKLAEIDEIFLFSYRNSYSQAIDCTPASKVFSFIPKTDLESNLKPNVETIKKKVSFKEDVNSKKNHAKIESKFKVGDLVWYKSEIRSTRSWLEAKIVGVNSTNTSYVDVNGALRLASRNQLKLRMTKREDYIYPKVVNKRRVSTPDQPRSPRSVSVDSPRRSPEIAVEIRRSKRVGKRPDRFCLGSL